MRRLGRARLGRFLHRHCRGAWGQATAEQILAAAAVPGELWTDELSYPDLAEGIALEARLALRLPEEITELDEGIAVLLSSADPGGIITSAPGVGPVTVAAILGRLADPNRCTPLAGARAYAVLTLNQSGVAGSHGGPTKREDTVLRQAQFVAADEARRRNTTG